MSARRRSARSSARAREVPLSWPQALECYAAHLRAANAAPRTVYDRRRHLMAFACHMEPRGPDQVELVALREYVGALLAGSARRRPISAASVATAVSALRAFFAFLHQERLLPRDPAARLERPHVPEREPRAVLTTREVARLLAIPDLLTPLGLRDRALLECFYVCGLRRSEVLGIDLADLCHREREIVVRKAKGRKPRIVPLPPSTYRRLEAYLSDGRPALAGAHPDSFRALFLNTRGRRLSPVRVNLALRQLRRLANLKKPLTPHRLRHACAVHLLQGGANLRVIQKLLGHTHLDTTAIYLHLEREEVRRSLLLHHPREKLDLGE